MSVGAESGGQGLIIEAKMPDEDQVDRLLSAVSWFGQVCSRATWDFGMESPRTAQPRASPTTRRFSNRPNPPARRDDVADITEWHLGLDASLVARLMNGCMCGRP
jgi:hypothetical protein